MDQYQVVTSTHSPFIVSPQGIDGYRRVQKSDADGAKAIALPRGTVDSTLLARHLERRGNLEGLFADRIVLMEGKHDEGFHEKLRSIFGIPLPDGHYTIFVKAGGKEELRQSRKFYKQMRFDDVAIICDLDYVFSNDFRNLAREIGVDEGRLAALRQHIDWTREGDPSLSYVIDKLKEKGEPPDLPALLSELRRSRIFALRHGCPENYYKTGTGDKYGWITLDSEAGLNETEYLREFMQEILS